jgi:NET1-associated nuclear protein 1 (U3 small nucleolar RNA-associated protein 17)
MTLHPSNPLHLITSSTDGTLRIWDWVEGRHVKTIKLPGSVLQMVTSRLDKWYIFCTIDALSIKKKDNGRQQAVYRVDLAGRQVRVGKLRSKPNALIISPSNTYLVALAANKAYVYRLSKDTSKEYDSVKFVSDQDLTCGAFAPNDKEEWFATGDAKGVIRLWHGLRDAFRRIDTEGADVDSTRDKRLPTTIMHWHPHAVAALAFTPSGAQLLSVGQESVLVQWEVSSGKHEFFPRLGGRPIISLAIKPALRGAEEEWWMGFSDGSVKKIGGSSGQVSQVGSDVKLDPLRPTSSSPYPLAIQPGNTGHLVVPSSHPSTLQFIDLSSSTVTSDLEVAPSNRIARRDDKEVVPVAVEHIAFTSTWMATIEGRQGDEAEGGGDVRTLKVWRNDGGHYKINTQLPRPHGSDPVTSIALAEHLLTCSATEAKIWSVRQAKKSDQGEFHSVKDEKTFTLHYKQHLISLDGILQFGG